MHLVELPVAFVTSPVYVVVDSVAVRHVIVPASFVQAAVAVYKPAAPVGLVVGPVPFVFGSIGPHLHALAVSEALLRPLALVHRCIFKLERTLPDQFNL